MTGSSACRTGNLTTLTVGAKDAGQRLDKFLAVHVQALGRRGVKRLFVEGKVQILGHPAKKSLLLVPGLEVTVELSDNAIVPEPGSPLSVLFETDALVAINKPAGQATLPRRAGDSGTAGNALLARFPECRAVGGTWDTGFVHRLDHFTSGVLIAARHAYIWNALREVLVQGRLVKRYRAIVVGVVPQSGTIHRAILPSPRSQRRVTLGSTTGSGTGNEKPRTTAFKLLEVRAGYSLLEVEVSRAYRHQIRAHLSSIGHPIVGDRVYGFGPVQALGERHALHASYAAFEGERLIPCFEVRAPLPADMATFWDTLPA